MQEVKVIITEHARQRIVERGGLVGEARARARAAVQLVKRGRVALIGQFPVLIVDVKPRKAVLVTALEPGMRLQGITPLEV